jgi:hypothetical protein
MNEGSSGIRVGNTEQNPIAYGGIGRATGGFLGPLPAERPGSPSANGGFRSAVSPESRVALAWGLLDGEQSCRPANTTHTDS